MSVKARIELEQRIVKMTIDAGLKAGYTLGVYDGEEFTVQNSKDADEIFGAMFTTDEDTLCFYNEGGARIGWVFFVYGNDGYDVINDHTTNLEDVLKPINEYCDSYMD
jgi:hypothetical protein